MHLHTNTLFEHSNYNILEHVSALKDCVDSVENFEERVCGGVCTCIKVVQSGCEDVLQSCKATDLVPVFDMSHCELLLCCWN